MSFSAHLTIGGAIDLEKAPHSLASVLAVLPAQAGSFELGRPAPAYSEWVSLITIAAKDGVRLEVHIISSEEDADRAVYDLERLVDKARRQKIEYKIFQDNDGEKSFRIGRNDEDFEFLGDSETGPLLTAEFLSTYIADGRHEALMEFIKFAADPIPPLRDITIDLASEAKP